MREANWDELFQRREAPPEEEQAKPSFPWEDWLTFALVSIVFLSVVASIDRAGWVNDMPSLYPIGFAGLLAGYALARVRLPEVLLHPVALLAGAALIYVQLIAIVPGGSVSERTWEIADRMRAWWTAFTQGGISSDTLPFIVMVLMVLWAGAYLSSWAIFRWRNAWLGLIPGGTVLMWNISFIPGQFSWAFVVFIFGAVLLLMRVHLSHREHEWERDGVRYPEFISLSALNVTFWVTIGLLVAVWAMPLAERSDTAQERWENLVAPVSNRLEPLARVFIGVNAKKPIEVHSLRDALALQGSINLSNREALEIEVETSPEIAAYLRSQSFDEYGASGWVSNIRGDVQLEPGERAGFEQGGEDVRREVDVSVTLENDSGTFLYGLGQPQESDQRADARIGDGGDVASLRARDRLRTGDTYTVRGSVSVASVEQLREAGTAYPAWTERYLQLPDNLPERVGARAEEVTTGAATPYDMAVAIEEYIRTFPNDFSVPAAPPGQDSVDYFLFDAQRGYFDYHASAMAVMLRTLGVPSRVAIGYVVDPDRRIGDSDRFLLTQRNAWAWPEVYFPGIGWVEFNPTPTQPTISRPGVLDELPEVEPRAPERPLGDEIDLGISLENVDRTALRPAVEEAGRGAPWFAMLALAVAGSIAVLAAMGGRFAWEYGLAGLSRPSQVWEKTLRLATLGRARPHPWETPREFATRLGHEVPQARDAAYLASAYERSRFGSKELDSDEAERLESAWRTVRNALLRRVFRRR
jgi:transglutaminase-like putative cysteine protease